MASDILIVDDEADIRNLIAGILEDEGYEARLAHDSDSALAAIQSRRPSLIVLDIWLQGSKLDGLDLLIVIKKNHPEVPVVIISGHGNIETAVSAIKRGAYEYIEKPFKADRLILVVGRALEASRLRRENEELKERAGALAELIGESAVMRQLRQLVKKVAPTNSRVLIAGPLGSGKELTARVLHTWSHRTDGPFVILSAATMAPERMEEELFGVENTDGSLARIGAFEEAHGGTLFIDEVADMPIETQGKILRVLVDQTFLRVGGSNRVKVDVRIVSSTCRDLPRMIEQGLLREDLYHRLNVVPIRLPALGERRDDIPALISHFIRQYSSISGQPMRDVSDDALAILQTLDWPGNVRQLRNNVERLMILAGGEPGTEITASMLPSELGGFMPPLANGNGAEQLMSLPLREAREIFEREYLAAQIARFGGNISKTAAFVGMERSALHRKLKLLGVGEKAMELH
ncbi:two-component system nitrogen regulation response regulator NtrX [Rhodoligotrophos appendicifer]|uniref:nitrogen assimilation response regulator NtrX n=1 Tax=Rhodoligotrophos appendicifer TaxID=987056 RepID=UPI001186BF0F|nr:sigma-54 dependent transcriptional regulator [Rhodoligotrophos appendicifer]